MGADLVDANLDDSTIARIRDAFANHVPSDHDVVA